MYVNSTLSLNIRKKNSFSESNDFATHILYNKLNKIPLINTLFFLAASQGNTNSLHAPIKENSNSVIRNNEITESTLILLGSTNQVCLDWLTRVKSRSEG